MGARGGTEQGLGLGRSPQATRRAVPEGRCCCRPTPASRSWLQPDGAGSCRENVLLQDHPQPDLIQAGAQRKELPVLRQTELALRLGRGQAQPVCRGRGGSLGGRRPPPPTP